MKARLLRLADMLRQSYWFLPSIMACAAILPGGMIWLDSYKGPSGWTVSPGCAPRGRAARGNFCRR